MYYDKVQVQIGDMILEETDKQTLIFKATDIIIRYQKLLKDTTITPTMKKIATKLLKNELLEIKEQLEAWEELENE